MKESKANQAIQESFDQQTAARNSQGTKPQADMEDAEVATRSQHRQAIIPPQHRDHTEQLKSHPHNEAPEENSGFAKETSGMKPVKEEPANEELSGVVDDRARRPPCSRPIFHRQETRGREQLSRPQSKTRKPQPPSSREPALAEQANSGRFLWTNEPEVLRNRTLQNSQGPSGDGTRLSP